MNTKQGHNVSDTSKSFSHTISKKSESTGSTRKASTTHVTFSTQRDDAEEVEEDFSEDHEHDDNEESKTIGSRTLPSNLFDENDPYFDIIRTMSREFQVAMFELMERKRWEEEEEEEARRLRAIRARKLSLAVSPQKRRNSRRLSLAPVSLMGTRSVLRSQRNIRGSLFDNEGLLEEEEEEEDGEGKESHKDWMEILKIIQSQRSFCQSAGNRRSSVSSTSSMDVTRRSSMAPYDSITSIEDEETSLDRTNVKTGSHSARPRSDSVISISKSHVNEGQSSTSKHPEWNFYDVPKNEALDPRWDSYWDTYGWGWKVSDEFRTTAEDYDSRFLDETAGGPEYNPVLRWEELTLAKDKCLAWLEQHVLPTNNEKQNSTKHPKT